MFMVLWIGALNYNVNIHLLVASIWKVVYNPPLTYAEIDESDHRAFPVRV